MNQEERRKLAAYARVIMVGMDDEMRHLIDASSSDGITVYRINLQKLPICIVETS